MTPQERMNYAGAIGLLCECSVHLRPGVESEELRGLIEEAVVDWASVTGFQVRRVLDRIEVFPPREPDA